MESDRGIENEVVALNYFGKWWLEFECHWCGFLYEFIYEVLRIGNCNWNNIKWTLFLISLESVWIVLDFLRGFYCFVIKVDEVLEWFWLIRAFSWNLCVQQVVTRWKIFWLCSWRMSEELGYFVWNLEFWIKLFRNEI